MRIGFKLRARMVGARLWPERMAADGGSVQSYERPGMPSAVGWPRRLIAALSSTLAAEQERWFPWSVSAFGAGIAAYFGLLAEPCWFIVGGIVVSCAVLGVIGAITANTVLRFA